MDTNTAKLRDSLKMNLLLRLLSELDAVDNLYTMLYQDFMKESMDSNVTTMRHFEIHKLHLQKKNLHQQIGNIAGKLGFSDDLLKLYQKDASAFISYLACESVT